MRNLYLGLAVAALLCSVTVGTANAQGWLFGVTYEMAVPTGAVKDFSQDSFSWRGVGLEGRKFIKQEVSIGLGFSWNVFHSEGKNITWSQPGQDITGTQFRDVNAVPIYANIFWNWGQRQGWRPFLGLNAGTMYTEHRLDLGLYSFRENNWRFAAAPEIGVRLPYNVLLGYVSVRWNYATPAGDLDEVSYFSIRVGIGLR